jgi:hypothetical protein
LLFAPLIGYDRQMHHDPIAREAAALALTTARGEMAR